ncbi:site-specific integrase [Bifidobacterium pullorum subsp. saeculare]|nr:site-specific integrase [Bifidobacterium pullorum subsp. saeculare]
MRVVLGGIMGYAVAQHWVDVNPVHAVTLPRITTRDEDMVLLNVEDIERLADAAAHVGKRPDSRRWQNGALVHWQAYVGTRIGEALALRVGDIDFDRRRARVRATWSDGDGAPVLTVPKNGKQRTVAWPSLLEEELWRLCDGRDPDDFLFAAPRGGAWSVRNWRNRIWAPAMRAAGLADSGATIHSLRHTYASLAIKAGADVKTLQAQLGHASAMMTLDTYAALWPENLGTVADALDALVTG